MATIDLSETGDIVVRLLPLPGVVLIPCGILPVRIFEPRCRQMTEDAPAPILEEPRTDRRYRQARISCRSTQLRFVGTLGSYAEWSNGYV